MSDRRTARAGFVPDLGPHDRALAAQGDHLASLDAGLLSLAGSITAMAEVAGRLISPLGMTIDQLPDPAPLVGRYARVTDLWGDSTTDLVLAALSGGSAYWMPVRPVHAMRRTANAAMTLQPLKSAQVQFLTGTLTANRTVTLGTQRVWPGATFDIAFDGLLGLFNLSIAGLAAGEVLGLVAGGRRRMIYADGGWRQF